MMVASVGRGALGVAILWAAVVVASPPARAEKASPQSADARAHYEKATTAYALGRYAEAAGEFEQAFALKPDPALLYNAAQAYRLAGRRDRALELYRNYLRVFGRRAEHASDVEWHIAELEKLGTAAPPPPPVENATAAPPAPLAATAQGLVAPPALVAAPALVAPPAPPAAAASRPVYERWWFWAGAGAIIVGAVVVGVVLANRKTTDCGPGVDYCANTGL
jgi:tetratricopeptide (TPR) repeat protein